MLPPRPTRRRYGLLFLFGAGLLITAIRLLPQEIYFETLDEFVQFAQRNDLHLHSGRQYPRLQGCCFVADHPVTFDHVGRLNMSQCGLTPDWNGIVYVTTYLPSPDSPFAILPEGIDGHHRIWGKLLAAGDKNLLDRLEQVATVQ